MQLDLTGRHALVCGASQGIGRASAIELAELGASVTLLARSADKLRAVADGLPRIASGPAPRLAQRRHARYHAAAGGSDSAGQAAPVHILINNTGGPPGGAMPGGLDRGFRAGIPPAPSGRPYAGAGRASRHARSGYGRIVNVISTSVKEPIAGLGVSNTVRAAVAGWAKTLSAELAADGITVNNVLPGYTRTRRLDRLAGSEGERKRTQRRTRSRRA